MRCPHAPDEVLFYRVLLEYSYPWLQSHAALVSPSSMDEKWPGPKQDDTLRHSSTAIWLLAATNAALSLTIEPETASYNLISGVIKQVGSAREYRYSGRLRTDLEYLTSFAQVRGMFGPRAEHLARLKVLAKGKVSLQYLTYIEGDELTGLLQWLIGLPDYHDWSQTTVGLEMSGDGLAACVAQLLEDMGLAITNDFRGE
jgi:hypothetical protein